MKLAIAILFLALACQGQSMPALPPTNFPAIRASLKESIKRAGDTNDYQPHITTAMLAWQLSRSPGIITQQVWGTLVLPPQWFFEKGLSNTATNTPVSLTNHAQEFFTVRVGNGNAWSHLP